MQGGDRLVDKGWIKIHRSILDNVIWSNSSVEQKVILITLLTMANHEVNTWEYKGEKFNCKPGQFVTSLNKIARKSGKGITIQNVRTALNRFEKLEFLTNESTKTGRLLTIVNWGKYQSTTQDTNIDINKDLTKTQQSTNKDLTTNKNDKNDKNDKNSKIVSLEDKKNGINYQQIADMYNDTCVSFPKLSKLSDSRKKAIKARLNVYTVDDFKKMFEMAESSDFLKGKNDKNWSATFDWLIKDSNMVKVLDGNYQNKDYSPVTTSDTNKPYHNILDDFDFSNYQPEEDVFAQPKKVGES